MNDVHHAWITADQQFGPDDPNLKSQRGDSDKRPWRRSSHLQSDGLNLLSTQQSTNPLFANVPHRKRAAVCKCVLLVF